MGSKVPPEPKVPRQLWKTTWYPRAANSLASRLPAALRPYGLRRRIVPCVVSEVGAVVIREELDAVAHGHAQTSVRGVISRRARKPERQGNRSVRELSTKASEASPRVCTRRRCHTQSLSVNARQDSVDAPAGNADVADLAFVAQVDEHADGVVAEKPLRHDTCAGTASMRMLCGMQRRLQPKGMHTIR